MIKHTIIFFLLMFNVGSSYSQSTIELSLNQNEVTSFWKADSLFNLGEYENALVFFKEYNLNTSYDLGLPIKKSLCLLLVGDTSAAHEYFATYVSKGGYYMNVDLIKQIPLYEAIARDEKVRNQFEKNTYAFEHSDANCLYPEVLKTLLEMREIDQAYRGKDKPGISSATIDSLNQIKLDSLISIYGWLGYKEVGKSGENASFLIAQHADQNLSFQTKCLALMKKELEKGNIYPPNFALLYDRVKVNSKESQLFGSQVELNETTNQFQPKKTISLELVNAYRFYFCLDTIESYLEFMNLRYEKN
jgi:hypothetical protein